MFVDIEVRIKCSFLSCIILQFSFRLLMFDTIETFLRFLQLSITITWAFSKLRQCFCASQPEFKCAFAVKLKENVRLHIIFFYLHNFIYDYEQALVFKISVLCFTYWFDFRYSWFRSTALGSPGWCHRAWSNSVARWLNHTFSFNLGVIKWTELLSVSF